MWCTVHVAVEQVVHMHSRSVGLCMERYAYTVNLSITNPFGTTEKVHYIRVFAILGFIYIEYK